MLKNREINGTEEIGLVTPTPAQKARFACCYVIWLGHQGFDL